jgi:hypothetical protein
MMSTQAVFTPEYTKEDHKSAVAALTSTEHLSSITKEEREERRDAINYARASVELEGFKCTPESDMHDQRFINGDITLAEYVAG